MSETFRPPKSVGIPMPPTLTFPEVAALRYEPGALGDWARHICAGAEQRAAIMKEVVVSEPMPEAVAPEMEDVAEKIQAAASAISAAQVLLDDVLDCMGAEEIEPEEPGEVETDSADLVDVEARRSLIDSAEKRSFVTEVRTEQTAQGTTRLRGYAAVFDQEATGLPFREVVKRGAFAESLGRGDEVYLLVNHNTDELPLGRRSSGTLNVSEDEHGLLVEAELDPSNPRAAELISVLSRGDVSEMSFAFRVAEGGSEKREDGVRELSRLDLFEVSVTTWGAYSQTDVGLRSAEVDDLALRWRRATLRQKAL